MNWDELQLGSACWDTLYMVLWSSAIAVVGGLPVGVLLVLTDRGGLLQNAAVSKAVGAVVNVGRSLPFIILMVALIPFTRVVVSTSIGAEAAVVPLSVAAIPFFARLVETALREVDHGLVEAVQAMGGSTWTVVRKVLLPEALPSLVSGLTTTAVALVGYTAMAGAIGAGGLGDLAIRYGYQRFDTNVMLITLVILVAMVTAIQLIGDFTARALARRGRASAAPRLRFLRTQAGSGA